MRNPPALSSLGHAASHWEIALLIAKTLSIGNRSSGACSALVCSSLEQRSWDAGIGLEICARGSILSIRTVQADAYDYPQFFELLFREDTSCEAAFFVAASQEFGTGKPKRFLEPGCGSGRLVRYLARRGYHVTGIDLSQRSLSYAEQRLADSRRRGYDIDVNLIHGDMTSFQLDEPFDVAYCPCNTFRHLLSPEAVEAHLVSVWNALKPGGIYVVGMHVYPPDSDYDSIERMTETFRNTTVSARLEMVEMSLPERWETLRWTLRVKTPKERFRLQSEFRFRTYTDRQVRRLLERHPEWELAGVYDFWYDLQHPIKLDAEVNDVVLVLRRRP